MTPNPPQPIEHEHKFVIPVEWREIVQVQTHFIKNPVVVTKLRCECGEEIDR